MTPDDDTRADTLLVLRCQLGERGAFDALVTRWTGPLLRHATRLAIDGHAAHDLAQETWLRVVRGIAGLRDAAGFRSWLFGIAHRVAMDQLRLRYATPEDTGLVLEDIAPTVDETPDPDVARLVMAGLDALPFVEREVVTLFHLEAFTLAEIAGMTGVPVGTVKSRLFRARALLRRHVAPLAPEEMSR